jgi:hypothetical protein
MANPNIYYFYNLAGLLWYDGVYSFDMGNSSHDINHLRKDAGEVKRPTNAPELASPGLISYAPTNEALSLDYEDNMAVDSLAALARVNADSLKDCIEAAGDWVIPEFSINGGSTWYTGDNRLVPYCKYNDLPLIKIKYNAASSEAAILAIMPNLLRTQTVHIRDTSKGLATSFVLYSNAPKVGRIIV